MGSTLYRVKIKKIEGDIVSCRIFIINPDAGDIPVSKTFALYIIIECWDNLLKGYFFPGESYLPISEEEGIVPDAEANGNIELGTFTVKYLSLDYGITHRFKIARADYLLLLGDTDSLLGYGSCLAANGDNIKAPILQDII